METLHDTSSALSLLKKVNQCQNEQQLETILHQLTQHLGFEHFFYRARFMLDRSSSLDRVLSNFPLAWLQHYENNNLSRIDPALQHAERKLTPMVWEPKIFVTEEQKRFSADAKRHGLESGVSFPVHNKDGDIGMLSLVLGADVVDASEFIQENLFYGPLIANFVHEAMSRLVNKSGRALKAPLTPRELECLKWIAGGKSTWETAQILHLSEHGVLHHVRNIMTKFDVTSRHQAVSRAVACGLV
ncbi:helix-turn-helix transcriptional regulator [Massilia glaciei]|uniref:LuxR family transcriptional regulator n=1 Tax=Massilia glaciei TaxID=1524097 RepID=A0A2U2HML8_9BURK|nr:LuxR family transcriptional regulator [Massilia glaciei]PWF48758.1 LuxR family transcriptional regulator [Massilia glaciei]